MRIKEVSLSGFRCFENDFVLKVIEGDSNANVAFIGCRQTMLELFKVLSLALSFSNEPDPFFDAELIAHGNATVKIEFISDETSGECPLMILERTITRAVISNKLDGNFIERVEVVHFLELLEFSRSYPYTFHIKPEDIERFTRPGDAITAVERWRILQRLVGAEEFLQSKARAQRILNETEDEIRNIDSLLRKFDGQFEIFVANETPVAYEKLSSRKRSLERCRRYKQISAIRQSIDHLSSDIERLEAARAERNQAMICEDVQASQYRQKKFELDRRISNEQMEKRNLIASMNETQRICDMLNERVNCSRSRLEADELVVSFAESEKSTVSLTLEEKQHQLKVLNVDYNRLTERSNELCEQMVPFEQCCQQLILKTAQNVRMNWKFGTEDDRNAWIDAELQKLAAEIKRKESQLKRSNTELETKLRMFNEKKTQMKEMNAMLENYGPVREEDLEDDAQRLDRKRDTALKNKQMVLEQIDKQQGMSQQIDEKFHEIENELKNTIGESLFEGLRSMEAILFSDKCPAELRDGCHGLIIDRLKSENNYNDPAVGVLAGPRLFHHIVDNAAIATRLIRVFNENQLPGEIFFITLEEIESIGDFDTLLGLDTAVPPDPFYGDFHQSFLSCMPAYRERMRLIDMKSACAHELRTLDYKLDCLNRSIQATDIDIQVSIEMRARFNQEMLEMKLTIDAVDDLEAKVKAKATQKARIANELNDLVKKKLRLETERKVALLTPDEQIAVDDVRRKIDAIAVDYRQNVDAMNEMRTRRNNLNCFIEKYLKRKQRDLDEVSMSYATQSELLDRDSSELDDSNETLNKSEAKLSALNETIEELNRESASISAELQLHRKRAKDMNAESSADFREKNRLVAERDRLKAELTSFGEEATPLLSEIDENIATLTVDELEQELVEINHQLRVFMETNQFDVERVENLKIEKQRLNQRLAELKKNGIELNRLIGTMNVENENATRETMNNLQTSFAYLFRRIVCRDDSSGRLELRPVDAATSGNEGTQELEILCTFPQDKELCFDQLSVNHKPIVALIFILAVLQCSPYAIYLLDHIDENIDEPYRRNIARYIVERSTVSQFFIAASHTELLTSAENVFEFTSSMPHQQANIKRIRPIESDHAET